MAKIFLFMMVSLDGYFEGPNHDLSWHNTDDEFQDFAIKQMGEVGTILFGRRTYDMMDSYWQSQEALTSDPVVSKIMTETPKVVFSHSLNTADWANTTLIKAATVEEINKLKQSSTKNLAILGSNNLCVHLMELGVVDEFRIMINPIALGEGNNLFKGISNKFQLKLINQRQFKNGNLLITYKPVE